MLIKGDIILRLLVTGGHIGLSRDDSLAVVAREGVGKDNFQLKG